MRGEERAVGKTLAGNDAQAVCRAAIGSLAFLRAAASSRLGSLPPDCNNLAYAVIQPPIITSPPARSPNLQAPLPTNSSGAEMPTCSNGVNDGSPLSALPPFSLDVKLIRSVSPVSLAGGPLELSLAPVRGTVLVRAVPPRLLSGDPSPFLAADRYPTTVWTSRKQACSFLF